MVCYKPFLKKFLLKKFSRICCLLFSYQCSLFCCRLKRQLYQIIISFVVCQQLFYFFLFRFCDLLNHFQATACLLYHISQLFVNNFFQVVFLSFDIAFSSHAFHYPARAVQHVLFCICCFSDEDYLTTAVLNCQRFSCFLFNSHNSDNSARLLILYTKYLFSAFTYNKHIIIKKTFLFTIRKTFLCPIIPV